jgi:hypothetical protein
MRERFHHISPSHIVPPPKKCTILGGGRKPWPKKPHDFPSNCTVYGTAENKTHPSLDLVFDKIPAQHPGYVKLRLVGPDIDDYLCPKFPDGYIKPVLTASIGCDENSTGVCFL